jgi:hypothetical protein
MEFSRCLVVFGARKAIEKPVSEDCKHGTHAFGRPPDMA